MDPLVGRAAELERTIQILARRQKNNPASSLEIGDGMDMHACQWKCFWDAFEKLTYHNYHVILP